MRQRTADARAQLLQRGKQLLPLRLFHGQQHAQQRHPVMRGIGRGKLPDERLVLRILQKRQRLTQKAARAQIGRAQNAVRLVRRILPQKRQRLILRHRAELQLRAAALVDRIRNTP